MTTPIYFCGQEDLSFATINCQYTASVVSSGSGVYIDTTTGHFRSGYARYGLCPTSTNVAGTTAAPFLITPSLSNGTGGITTFWYSARVYSSVITGLSVGTSWVWVFRDVNGVNRLRMRNTTGGPSTESGPFAIEKINAAGTVTQLGSNTTSGFTHAPTTPDKLDVFLNYGTSGTITVYINGGQIFTYSGDTTTDGNTVIDQVVIGTVTNNNQPTTNQYCSWSEIIVSSRDTRAMNLVTQTATASGNTNSFTNGAAFNVNGNQYSDTTPDYSTTANQIQEYQVTPGMPSGTFGVIGMVQHGRCVVGASGPAHIQFMVYVAGNSYNSSSFAPTLAFSLITNNWSTNPNTGNPWQTTDFVSSSNSFNLGYESIT